MGKCADCCHDIFLAVSRLLRSQLWGQPLALSLSLIRPSPPSSHLNHPCYLKLWLSFYLFLFIPSPPPHLPSFPDEYLHSWHGWLLIAPHPSSQPEGTHRSVPIPRSNWLQHVGSGWLCKTCDERESPRPESLKTHAVWSATDTCELRLGHVSLLSRLMNVPEGVPYTLQLSLTSRPALLEKW